jgi:hypothetical protein
MSAANMSRSSNAHPSLPRGKRWQGRWTSQDRGRGSPITIRIINMKLPKSGMATALEEKGLDARASHAGPLNPERADCELTVSSPDSILTAIIHTGMIVIEMHSNVLSHCPFSIMNSNDMIPTAGDTSSSGGTESFKWVLS